MSRRSPSGSPTAWNERRKAYRKAQGPVSNPGQPSNVNREARRAQLRLDAATLSKDDLYGGPSES